MPYERLSLSRPLIVGTKQTMKCIEQGQASEVFIASDADQTLMSRVSSLCIKMGVRVTYVDSMKSLGKACGIDVGAAVVAIKQV